VTRRGAPPATKWEPRERTAGVGGEEGEFTSRDEGGWESPPTRQVPRDRIELPTRGFSIPAPRGVSDWDHYGKLMLVRVV